MHKDVRISWERFLNPHILRTNLIVASLYITAFEMLKDSIIDRIREFFSSRFDQNGPLIDEEYKTEVLSRDRSPLYASLLWLRDMHAVDEQDIELFKKIRKCRNELAHEIATFISKETKIEPIPLFGPMVDLLHKIEKWWIVNVEIPTDPDLVGKEIDEDGIIPGPIMTLRLLIDIALGTEEESEFFYKEFKRRYGDI